MAGLITENKIEGIKRVGELSLNKNIERFGELGLNLITGDTTKGIKRVGELALRISKFDSYRLFTLYENVNEKKVMNVSGDQKHYLVFRSPKKEIRIPESVTKLGNSCFSYCKNLSKIELNENITEIPEKCFYCCINLQKITIPESVIIITSPTLNSLFMPPAALLTNKVSTPNAFITRTGKVTCFMS